MAELLNRFGGGMAYARNYASPKGIEVTVGYHNDVAELLASVADAVV